MPKNTTRADLNKQPFNKNSSKYSPHQLLNLLIFLKNGVPKVIRKQFFFVIDFFANLAVTKSELLSTKGSKNIQFLHVYCNELLEDLNAKGLSRDNQNIQIIKKYMQMYDLHDLFTVYYKNIHLQQRLPYQQYMGQTKITTNLFKNDKITFTKPFNIVTKSFAIKEMQLDLDKKIKSNALLMPLFKPNRIINKIQQICHLRKQNQRDGHVLAIDHGGHMMVGMRSYAILKKNWFQIWQRGSLKYPEHMFINWHEDHRIVQKKQSIFEINGQFYPRSYFQRANKDSASTFRLSHKFIGHKSRITCASFSSDQFYLITGSVDRVIKLWCLRLKIVLAQFKLHTKTVWDLHFNPSGYYFLSGSSDGFMVLWKTDTATPQRLFRHASDVYKVRFCHDPNYAMSGGQDGSVKIWQIADGKMIKKIQFQNAIGSINLGYSGNYMMIVQIDGKVTIHNLTTGTLIKQFYFYSNLKQNSKTNKKIRIHDGCFSQDQKEMVCITQRHILFYHMANLTCNKKCNIYDDFYLQSLTQNKIIPEEIISIQAGKRLTSCQYVEFGLLVVGTNNKQA